MRKALLPLLLAIAAQLAAAAGAKEVIVAAGETRTAAVNALGTRLAIHGRLEESVFLLGGSLLLEGQVTGDVICIAARVEIGERAVIGRDLIVIGGELRKAGGARVEGEIYNVHTRKDLKKIASSVLPFLPESGGMTFFKVIKIFFWLILSLLALAIFPVALARAAALLPAAPLRHLLRGLLVLLTFLLLLLAFLLLSLVLIGIPLLIVLLAAYFLLLIFGRTAVLYFVGDRLARWLGLRANPALYIVLGVGVYTLLKFLPVAGIVLLLFLDFFALGIGAGYVLSRRKGLA